MDYSSMSNEELRRAIAERLGWNIRIWDRGADERKRYSITISNPDGDRVFGDNVALKPDAEDIAQFLPGYTHSTDTAFDLWGSKDICLIQKSGKWLAGPGDKVYPSSLADIPARAICLAWLAWKDAQG